MRLIEYIGSTGLLKQDELSLVGDLRVIRNRISYDGFFVESDYLERNLGKIETIVSTLKEKIKKKTEK